MGENLQDRQNLQWHPALFADIQIELSDEMENLIFENEHQLGTKPKMIDILIKKRDKNIPVRKNIGKLFREHNIIEYKSPTDTLNVNDFYKTYAYACFYKADTAKADDISVTEITITFICHKYPRKLLKHLKEKRNYTVSEIENGIFHVEGDLFPMQIIVLSRLSEEENFWLRNLTDDLPNRDAVDRLIAEYEDHKDNILYQSVMDIIIRANVEKFKEVDPTMCQALMEVVLEQMDGPMRGQWEKALRGKWKYIMKDEFEESTRQAAEQGLQQGEDCFARLTQILLKNNSQDQLLKATTDKEYRKELYVKYGIL